MTVQHRALVRSSRENSRSHQPNCAHKNGVHTTAQDRRTCSFIRRFLFQWHSNTCPIRNTTTENRTFKERVPFLLLWNDLWRSTRHRRLKTVKALRKDNDFSRLNPVSLKVWRNHETGKATRNETHLTQVCTKFSLHMKGLCEPIGQAVLFEESQQSTWERLS